MQWRVVIPSYLTFTARSTTKVAPGQDTRQQRTNKSPIHFPRHSEIDVRKGQGKEMKPNQAER